MDGNVVAEREFAVEVVKRLREAGHEASIFDAMNKGWLENMHKIADKLNA